MIRITHQNELIKMYIQLNIEHTTILDFLNNRGYKVKSFLYKTPVEKGFLIDEPATERWTFTATKEGETQSESNLFLKVFEKEIKLLLKEVSK